MNPRDDELLDRALLGELSLEEESALAGRLRADPALARRLVELSRDEAILTEWAAARRALARERAASRWSARPLLAAAAVLLVGILAFVLWPAPRGAAERPGLVSSEGPVDWDGRSLRSGAGGRASLRYPDGTALEVREKTELLLEGRAVRLLSGSIAAQVEKLPPGESFTVATPHADARVLGTRFEVWAGAATTRLAVDEGRVLLVPHEGGPPLEVPAGHFAVAEPGRPLEALPFLGTGLFAEYYDAPDLTRPRLSRIDPKIDFDWGVGAPDPALKSDGFSVRWSGRVLPRFGGTYTFETSTDDGARLWVDGRLLVDQFREQGRTVYSGSVELTAWRPVEIRMEAMDAGGPAAAQLFWSGPSTPRQIVPAEVLFPAPAEGRGLKGEYFDNDTFTNLRHARVDPAVHFNWGLDPPHSSIEPDYFSVRWTGQVEAARTETVTFTTVSDDGVRLWVDGRLLIDDWTVRGTAERSGAIDLVAGRRYDLKLEYFQWVATANVRLLWASPAQPQQAIPRERLFPAP